MEEYLIYFYQKGNNNDIYECKIIIFLLDEKKISIFEDLFHLMVLCISNIWNHLITGIKHFFFIVNN